MGRMHVPQAEGAQAMILGHGVHPASRCFDELDAAISALTQRTVCLNAHAFPRDIPHGAVVYNLENVGTQVQTDAFEGHEIWDFSARNVERWKAAGRHAVHVPIGYHPSFERFVMRPWAERDIDVVFCGCMSERRAKVLQALADKGLKVHLVGPGEAYGAERDAILARSKLALNMLFEDGNTFPVLRAAHAAANGLPMISESAPEMPEWVDGVAYESLVREAWALSKSQTYAGDVAASARHAFVATTMTLPDPWACLRGPQFIVPDGSTIRSIDGGSIVTHGASPPTFLPPPSLEAMYEARRGKPVSSTPIVCIAVATYRETERVAKAARATRNQVREDLAAHGIDSFVLHLDGDSLICRMRQRACHHFLESAATHLLFWDADIAARDPDCVRKMIASGHPIVAGACPFKDMSGRTVHNLFPADHAKIQQGVGFDLSGGCIEVRDAGTGFMLIQRRTLIELQQAHPELLHWSQDQPLWALFDTGVVDAEYRSEDYYFCELWRRHGGKVHVYVPARFTHYGEHGFEGSFMEQYGLEAS